MKLKYILIATIVFFHTALQAGQFTISSYNCGGLSDHYDYLRAAAMQKLMQKRYNSEPELMANNEKVQTLALKIGFGPQAPQDEEAAVQADWEKTYAKAQEIFTKQTGYWQQELEKIITSYKVRPVEILDPHVKRMLEEQQQGQNLDQTRAKLAKHIFHNFLRYDILCLQEADNIHAGLLPKHYQLLLSEDGHKNGIAWNTYRFDHLETLNSTRAFVVRLKDKQSGKTVAVASGHLKGCNPYTVVNRDSAEGDTELSALVDLLKQDSADFKIIGMDSNVTALHPRMDILKKGQFKLDYENYLEPTCSNPNLVVDTRIDWIALNSTRARIINIPVHSVGLNSIQTNISDHKPIAAKVIY